MHKHTNGTVRALTIFGAVLLIGSSAALGAFYGYTVGAHSHEMIGVVFAAAALGGELLKPFAVAGAIDFLRAREFLRAIAAALLAAVCVTYSVSAELSLASGGRNDLASERQASADAYERSKERRAQIVAELAATAPARTAAELEPLVTKLLSTPGANGCKGTPERREAKRPCADVANLKSEIGRAERRSDLQTQLDSIDSKIEALPPVAPGGDPLAKALSVYASAFGHSAAPDAILPWLALIPVLFLELGSALALVALGGHSPQAGSAPAKRRTEGRWKGTYSPATSKRRIPTRSETDLLEYLQSIGGEVSGGQRSLAKAIGLSKTRVNEVLRDLASAGRIFVETSASGTTVRLAVA